MIQLRRRRAWITAALLAPALFILLVFFAYPLWQIVVLSVSPGFTLRHYEGLGRNSLYAQVLWNTFKIGGEVAMLCLLIGYPMAYALVHARPRLRRLLVFVVLLPFWTSVLVRTYAWMVLLQKQGLLNKLLMWLGVIDEPLSLMFNEVGVLVGMVHVLAPFMIFPIYASLASIDPSYVCQKLGLLSEPVAMGPIDLAKDLSRVHEQDLLLALGPAFPTVEKPQSYWKRHCVEEVGTYGDHYIDDVRLDQFAADVQF